MQGTVEVISESKKGFRVVGQEKGAWYNKSKFLDEDLIPSLKKGDTIEFTAPDGKWITKLEKLEGANATVSSESMPEAKAVFHSQGGQVTEKSNSISRGCAVNAVLGSTYLPELLTGGSSEETLHNVKCFIEKTAEFVYGGSW